MIASDIHGTKQTSFWIVLSKLKIQGDFIPCSSIFSSQRRTEIHNINIWFSSQEDLDFLYPGTTMCQRGNFWKVLHLAKPQGPGWETMPVSQGFREKMWVTWETSKRRELGMQKHKIVFILILSIFMFSVLAATYTVSQKDWRARPGCRLFPLEGPHLTIIHWVTMPDLRLGSWTTGAPSRDGLWLHFTRQVHLGQCALRGLQHTPWIMLQPSQRFQKHRIKTTAESTEHSWLV